MRRVSRLPLSRSIILTPIADPFHLRGGEFMCASGEVVLRGGGGDVEAHQLPSTPRGRSPSAQR
jgi:hypothetical protein